MTAPQLEKMKFWIIKPKAGRNAIPNPTFAMGISGWLYSVGTTSIEQSGDESRWGAYSLKVNTSANLNCNTFRGISVVAGSDYTFSVYVKGTAGQQFKLLYQQSVDPWTVYKEVSFTATGYWQREELSWTSSITGSDKYLVVRRMAIDSADPFYVDGVQFEQESKATTFIQGYMGKGYSWEGARNVSASLRANDCKTGGELLDLDDYCSVASVTGLGHGDWNQILTKMTSGGDLYQDYIRKSRQFSIVVDFIGNSLGEIEGNRKTLIDALRPDLFEGEMVVRYQGFAANGDEATNPVDIHCVPLPATLTDTPDLPTYQRAVLNFSVPSGLLDGAYEEGKGLDLFAEFPAEYIVKRDPQGNWCKWNGSAYVNPLAGVNGIVYDIKEAPNGDIYICGYFTGVSNGASPVANTKGIARWSKASQIWEAVGNPVTGATITSIRCIAFDANGDLYVGGGFTNLAGIANADYFAKYTVSTNTWSAVGSGIDNDVTTIEISSSGTIYIGGDFTTASGNTNCNYIAYWTGTAWSSLATGLNDFVYALKFRSNGDLLIGGQFSNAAGTNGDYICYWDGGAFKSFYDLGATELSVGSIVQSIDINPNGTIIIGGEFTNAGGDANANYVAAWRGNNWGSLMAGGVNALVRKVYCDDNGDIYLGGKFTQAGSLTLTDRVVKSVQGAYQPMDIDLPGIENVLAVFKASDGSLYIGGNFSTAAASENAKTGAVALNLNVASASANTYPFFQIHGPGTLKSIINYSTGANAIFDGLTIQTGEHLNLWFDPNNLRFTSSWKGRGSVLRYVSAGSDYGNFYLKPGVNYISLFMGNTTSNSKAWIKWTPKFWGIDGVLYE